MKAYRFKDRTAVITGAAGGIGRALAVDLARRGCGLALADRDPSGLEATAAVAQAFGVRASRHVLDLTDREAVAALPDAVREEHGGADLLINNAGVALGGTFDQVAEADFDWLFEVNFHAVVRLTRGFLPLLKASDDARLVNLSSVFGVVAPPGQTAYSASKFAVRGFSMALHHELQGTSVGVTVVHPGGVATGIAAAARLPESATEAERAEQAAFAARHLRMPPDTAAELILRGVERRRTRVLVGSDAAFLALTERLFPASYWRLLAALGMRGRTPPAAAVATAGPSAPVGSAP